MQFSGYFRFTSYATVAAAALALFVAGGVNFWLLAIFALVMLLAFKLEGSRWQLSERVALATILSSVPVFYLDWRVLTPYLDIQYLENGQRTSPEVAILSHLILFLSAVKLLQRKVDRDWFFLYLISFFTVLLAAGLTAKPVFLAVLLLYLLCALSTVIAFEIQKARRKVTATQTRLLVPPDSTLFQKLPMRLWRRRYLETRRLPLVSVGLLVMIVLLALPFFLIAPRTSSSALRRGGKGVSGFIGFSDNVTLGQIGELKASDEIFMHVRIDSLGGGRAADLRWRGVALDEFNGRGWKNSSINRAERRVSDSGFFRLGTLGATEDVARLTSQTFIIEPVDTPVVFAAPRVVALQAELRAINVDSENSLRAGYHLDKRFVYKAYSDMAHPGAEVLRSDPMRYAPDARRYLEFPVNLDQRIRRLTRDVIERNGAQTGYDKARVIESYLRDNYGYTLEMKAGGADPLADFLLNVKQGHCEYFATAMAVMLRTQGIATRVVNGFLPGEYNTAAGAFTVRQSDAHSWVEVYFPQTNSWVTFDPTPPAGRTGRERSGFSGALSKYSEALDLLWFQYVVGYDKQEQRTLITSLRNGLVDARSLSGLVLEKTRKTLSSSKGWAVVTAATIIVALLIFFAFRVKKFGWSQGLMVWTSTFEAETSKVEFYERLLRLLERQGFKRDAHQTPLEFAAALPMPEALMVTKIYNRVRFGGTAPTGDELEAIRSITRRLERGISAQHEA